MYLRSKFEHTQLAGSCGMAVGRMALGTQRAMSYERFRYLDYDRIYMEQDIFRISFIRMEELVVTCRCSEMVGLMELSTADH